MVILLKQRPGPPSLPPAEVTRLIPGLTGSLTCPSPQDCPLLAEPLSPQQLDPPLCFWPPSLCKSCSLCQETLLLRPCRYGRLHLSLPNAHPPLPTRTNRASSEGPGLCWDLDWPPLDPQHPEQRLSHSCRCSVTQSCPTLPNPMDCSPARLLCQWDSPGKNTGMGCHFLLQGIFPMQESNQHLLFDRWILYHGATWEALS